MTQDTESVSAASGEIPRGGGAVPGSIRGDVTAVIVARTQDAFLASTLAAVAAQTVTAARTVVVDVSRAGDVTGPEETIHAPSAQSFGSAVAAAVVDDDARWLWLLHADSAPEPDALEELLRAVEHKPSVAIAGVKQRDWFEPTRLLEVGLTTSPAGRRMTGIELGEVDQGQHDGREDVLAVGLVGALFRSDVWAELRGTDPEYGLFGDGLEVGVRARRAGYRVVVVPAASVRHAQQTFNGLAPREAREIEGPGQPEPPEQPEPQEHLTTARYSWDRERSFGARRRAALWFRLVGAPGPVVPLAVIAMVVLAPVRALWQLTLKRPTRARFELTSVAWAVLRPIALIRSRSRAARTAQLPRRALRPLRASWRDVWAERRDLRLARAELRRTQVAPDPLDRADRRRDLARRLTAAAIATAGLLALSGVWFGPLVGAVSRGGRLISDSLLLGQDSGGELWRTITDGWSRSGFGTAAPADPLLTVLTPFAFLGSSGLQSVIHVVVLGSLVLGGLGAWFAAGLATSSLGLRAWAVAAWVSLPMAVVAISEGRFGSILVHAALPWAVLGALRAVGLRRPLGGKPQTGAVLGAGSIPAAAGAGFALALAVGGAPILLVPALLGLLVVAVLVPRRRGERSFRRNLVLVAIPSIVIVLPLVREVGRLGWSQFWPALLAAPGAPVPADTAPGWQQLLGWPSGPQQWWAADGVLGSFASAAPFALGGLGILLALGALLRGRPVAGPVRGAWLVAGFGLAGAIAAGYVVIGLDGRAQVHAWSGPLLSFAFIGFLAAGLMGLDGLTGRAAQHSFGWRQSGIVLLAVVVVVVSAGSLTQSIRANRLDPVAGTGLRVLEDPIVPAVGQQIQAPPRQARVLMIDVGRETTYQVLRADGPQLSDASAIASLRELTEVSSHPAQVPDEGTEAGAELAEPDDLLASITAQLLGGVDAGAENLIDLGVGAVVLASSGPDSDRVQVANRLDTISRLERIAQGPSGVIWRVAVLESEGPAGDGFEAQPSWARLMSTGAVATDEADDADSRADVGVLVPSSGQEVDTTIEAADDGRLLVLADRADPGWRASLDGERLRVVDGDWRQTFEVGRDGGELRVWYETPGALGWRIVLLSVLGLYLLLAVPVRRRAGVR